ncbi:diguanylate cyclase [Oceanospirillum sp.]|uniref:sensor domain-containing diguanylate cyclase n=1 Tax=Oceanospirillum sp. TaxID=2021254 RepID=UPI003A94EF13
MPHLSDESLLRTVIDESPDIILMKNYEGDFLLCNQALARLYDSTPEQMIGKSDADFNPDTEQVKFFKENTQAIMRSGKVEVVEETSTDNTTGEVRYFESIKKPLKAPDGQNRILVIAHDITELKRAYQTIEEKEKRYSYAMEAAGEGIWDWDIPANTVHHNRKWCELLGLDNKLSVHKMDELADFIHPEDRIAMMSSLKAALDSDGIYSHEHRMLKNNQEIWVYDRGRVVEYDAQGKPSRMVGSISDVTTRKKYEQRLAEAKRDVERSNERLEHLVSERTSDLARVNQELKALATKDALTGVGNRILLNSWLAEQAASLPIIVIMLDIDHFKEINDQYGHKTGDRVLQSVAANLSQFCSCHDLVIRFGGEEFLLVLPDEVVEQAHLIAEALRRHIEQLQSVAGIGVTVSIGLAAGCCETFDAALHQADKALYRAKKLGRNQVVAA